MAVHILSDREPALNLSVNQSLLNDLSETIAKACALTQIPLCGDFWCFSQETRYDYCWAIADLMHKMRQLCDQLELDSR